MIDVKLKDGSSLQVEQGSTVAEVAKQISMGLYRNAVGGLVDGEVADLRQPLEKDCSLEILTFEDAAGKRVFWHTASHVLAQAVQHLFPGVKFAIGPAIDGGFYYDFDVEKPFTTEDLEKIEAEMKKIAKEALPLERFELDPAEAKELMADQPYKLELIEEHAGKGEKISFFKQGDFTDLCAGPHLLDTSKVKAVKLTSATGAYWRGDSDKAMLCRVYGTAFPKASLLEEHLALLEEAKKRDHRKLGKELELFTLLDEGPGFPFFLPKGMVLKNTLIDYWREIHHKAGYQEISTPIILSRTLWERSGHWGHYKDNMYTTVIDEQDFAIKPMNCPGGMLVYKTQPHSYRDLPMRVGELGLVHRHELSGALHGLMRVRCFTQDDAHIFMLPSQMEEEISGVIDLFDKAYNVFGLEYRVELSTRPEDSMGSDEIWELATSTLRKVLEDRNIPYQVNEGDGAFYGPKLDFHVKDSIGRTWQCGTIQLDMLMPERFDMTYVGEDGQKHRPVMVHRTCFGSIERFLGILIENYAGAFPVWLAPVQIKFLPISDKHLAYALELRKKFKKLGIRVEVDESNEKIGYKIRKAQMEKVPYMAIIGDKEIETNTLSLRDRAKGDLGAKPVDEVVAHIQELTATRKG